MHFLLVFIVCLSFYPDVPVFVEMSWTARVLWTVASVVGLGLLAELLAWSLTAQLRCHAERRSQILHRYNRLRLLHFVLTLVLYAVTLMVFGWGSVVRSHWGLARAIALDEILVLAPFLVSITLGWFSFYRVERAAHDLAANGAASSFWSRGAYVMFHVRHYLGLILAPILLFTAINEAVIRFIPGVGETEWFQLASIGILALTVLILMPWLLTVIWGAKSLPPGPLRDRLMGAARRLRFGYTDILLWNTRGGVANAMVTGIFPIPRYVLLSDALVQNLRPEEVEAVFGHEVGHVKHHHMLLYLGFLLLSLTALAALGQAVLNFDQASLFTVPTDAKALRSWTSYLAALVGTGCYIWLVFGFLSRRCERQADVHGCRTVSCDREGCIGHGEGAPPTTPITSRTPLCPVGISTFISALEQVADLNGIRRDKPSWRHSSIARRVAFLKQLLIEPEAERRFQRRLKWVKWGLVLLLVMIIVVFGRRDIARWFAEPDAQASGLSHSKFRVGATRKLGCDTPLGTRDLSP